MGPDPPGPELDASAGDGRRPDAPPPGGPVDLASAVRQGARLVYARAEGELVSDYNAYKLVAMEPNTFPNGTGARPKRMSMQTYGRLLMARAPRTQHAANPMLSMAIFNIQQRMQVNASACVQSRLARAGDWDGIASLPLDTVLAVSMIATMDPRSSARKEAEAELSTDGKRLLRSLASVGARVVGSPGSYASLRSAVAAGRQALGVVTAMVNVNPSEFDAPWTIWLATGERYDFDPVTGEPGAGRPNQVQQWKLMAQNPWAIAVFHDVFTRAVCDLFFHWPVGAAQQEQRGVACPFGRLYGHMQKFESSERVSIHTHMALIQALMQPEHMSRLLGSEATRGRMLELLMRCSYAALPDVPTDIPGSEGHRVYGEGFPPHAHDPPNPPDELRVARPAGGQHRVTACRPPLPPRTMLLRAKAGTLLPGEREELKACATQVYCFVGRCVLATQIHEPHNPSCAKNGGKCNDLNCRFLKPRPCVLASAVGLGGMVMLRRDHKSMVPIHVALMMACPMNMAMYVAADLSRFLRQLAIYNMRVSRGKKATPPPHPDLHRDSGNFSEYSSKYNCKVDLHAHNHTLADVLELLHKATAEPGGQQQTLQPDAEVARRNVARCLHKVHGSLTYPSTLLNLFVTSSLGDALKTWDCAYLPVGELLARLDAVYGPPLALAQDGAQTGGAVQWVAGARGDARMVSTVTDYRLRGSQLDWLSPWMYVALFEKVPMPKGRGASKRKRGGRRAPTDEDEAREGSDGSDDGSDASEHSGSDDEGPDAQGAAAAPPAERVLANEQAPPDEDADLPRTSALVIPFKKNHPQSLTHCIRRRCRVVVPNTRRDPPPPAGEGDTPAAKDAWARWAISQLVSDRWNPASAAGDGGPAEAAGPETRLDAWGTLQAWLALEQGSEHAPFVRLGRVLLGRWAGYASTRVRAAQRNVDEGERLKEAVQAAAAAGLPDFPAGTFDWGDLADEDAVGGRGAEGDADDGGDEAEVHLDDDAAAVLQQLAAGEEAALAEQLLEAAPVPSDAYVSAALVGVPDVRAPAQQRPGERAPPLAAHPIDSDAAVKQPLNRDEVAEVARRAIDAEDADKHYRPPLAVLGGGAASEGQAGNAEERELHVWRGEGERDARAHVHVYLMGERDEPHTVEVAPAGSPPFVKAAQPPSIADAMDLFTLGDDQRIAFALLAEGLQQTAAALGAGAPLPPQRRFLIMGGPGTGKSRVINALSWYAFQLELRERLVLTSFTWRATAHISTPAHQPESSFRTFGLKQNNKPAPKRAAAANATCRAGLLVVNDETSFTPPEHLAAISGALARHRVGMPAPEGATVQPCTPFGGVHVALIADFNQLHPVAGPSLTAPIDHVDVTRAARDLLRQGANDRFRRGRGAGARRAPQPQQQEQQQQQQQPPPPGQAPPDAPQPAPGTADQQQREGRALFTSCTHTITLRQQHRQRAGEGGNEVLDALNVYMRMTNAQRATLAAGFIPWFVDALNSRYVGPERLDLLFRRGATVVTPRNVVRQEVSFRLALLAAEKAEQRALVWSAVDSDLNTGHLVTDAASRARLLSLEEDKVGGLLGRGVFFTGCRYLFHDSDAPGAGRVTSGTAVGVDVVLDHREPPDTGAGPFWSLHYPPILLVLRPVEGTVGGDAGGGAPPTVPPGCVGLRPTTSSAALNRLAQKQPLRIAGQLRTALHLHRKSFDVGLAYAFTDYYCQGGTFQQGEPWVLHLSLPPTGSLSKRGVFVMCTRFKFFADLYLLAPLYTTPAERARVIARYVALFTNTDAEEGEMARLAAAEADTRARLAASGWLAQYGIAAAPPPPPPARMRLPSLAAVASACAAYEARVGRWQQ